MKKSIIIIAVIVVIAGFFAGKHMYNKKNMQDKNKEEIIYENKLASKETENTGEKILVDSIETRITPNTKIIEKVYYKDCNHLVIKEEKADEELVNLNERDLKEKIPNCEIQKFTSEEIVIYKEVDDFCNEHYLIKDNEGYLGIYQLDKNGNVKELVELTEIATDFLPEEDKERIKDGLRVDKKEELSKIVEDFE